MKRETRARRVSRKLGDLKAGKESKVTAGDLMSCEVGEVPLPDERAVLHLARLIHRLESDDIATSWSAQERAMDHFNRYGLIGTLDRMFELEKQLEQMNKPE